MSIGNDIILCPLCDGKRGDYDCILCKGAGRIFTWTLESLKPLFDKKEGYWKKRYEKTLKVVSREFGVFAADLVKDCVEEEIEVEEIEHEGTVEDAKVRKVTRHDTP